MAAAANTIPVCSSAEEAEALALLHGARLAKDWTIEPIIFESDNSTIVKLIQNDTNDLSHIRSILHDFRSSLIDRQNWSCLLAKRSQNSATHECNAYARFTDHECI